MSGTEAGAPTAGAGDASIGLLARLSRFVFGRVGSPEQSAANQGWILVNAVGIIAGFVLLALLSSSPRGFAAACLLALAAVTTGSLVGFLFGLPRSTRADAAAAGAAAGAAGAAGDTPPPSAYRPNTNLEDISDWLTKILVGLGLTQLGSIPAQFKSLMDTTKVVIGTSDDASAIAGSVIVGYVILGFLATYLWARTRLTQALRLADATATARLDRMEAQISDIRSSIANP